MFSLVQFRTPGTADGIRVGVFDGTAVRVFTQAAGLDLMSVLEQWSTWSPVLRGLDVEDLEPIPGAQLIAPQSPVFGRQLLRPRRRDEGRAP